MAPVCSQSAWKARLLYPVLLLTHRIYAADDGVFCNGGAYGRPVSVHCINALTKFPIHDTTIHYFVEQQLRTAPPEAVWNECKDPRPASEAQSIIQLPKWISYGQKDLHA